jgi:hypothetical protein
MTNQPDPIQNLLSLIFQSGGTIRHESGMLLVSPKTVALRFSEQIRTHKPELIKVLKQAELETIREGTCPICKDKLDLQGKHPAPWWWCAGCRKHWNEGDYA